MTLNYVYKLFYYSPCNRSCWRILFSLGLLLFTLTGYSQTPTVSITNNSDATEGAAVPGSFVVEVAPLAAFPATSVLVNYVVLPSSTATSGVDYTALSGQVLVNYGFTGGSAVINVNQIPFDDLLVEGEETVEVLLTVDAAYDIDPRQSGAAISIFDNDFGTVGFITAQSDAIAAEEPTNTGLFSIDLSEANNTGAVLEVDAVITGSTATNIVDFTFDNFNVTTGSIGFADGAISRDDILVNVIDDVFFEGDETVTITLTGTNNPAFTIGANNTFTVTIEDNDFPEATVIASDANAAESMLSNQNGQFRIAIGSENQSGAPITVNYTITGTATNADDYTTITNSIDIPVGASSANIPINVVDDTSFEGEEEVILTILNNPAYTTGTQNTATVRITDNDIARATIIANDPEAEEDIANSETGEFTIDMGFTNGTLNPIVVNYTISGNAVNGTDYTTLNNFVMVPIGARTATILVAPVDDAIFENNEDVTITLGIGTGYALGTPNTATVVIEDNEPCGGGTMQPTRDMSVSTVFCDAQEIDLNTYVSDSPPGSSVLTWSTSDDPLDTAAHLSSSVVNTSSGGIFNGFFYDATNNCSSPVLPINITINTTPTITTIVSDPVCNSGEVTFTAIFTTGAQINWYDVAAGGSSLASGASFTSPFINVTTTYYVEVSVNGCISDRTAVEAIVSTGPNTGETTNTAACTNIENGPVTVDLDNQITGADAGVWSITTEPAGSAIVLGSDNSVDFTSQPSGDYVFTYTAIATAPCDDESVLVTISVGNCTLDSDNDGLLDGEEAILGTDPNNPDTDGDAIEDGIEVGDDVSNPLDEDNDGIFDVLDSNILDSDMDGVADQQDPANTNPCIPNASSPACPPSSIDLAITKSVDDESPFIGDTVTFTIEAINTTTETVDNALISEVIGGGFEYISHAASNGDETYDSDMGIWELNSLFGEESNTLTIAARVLSEGPYLNVATLLISSPNDINQNNNEAFVNLILDDRGCDIIFNQFSPNSDGVNDFLKISCITEYPNNSLQIFNRYGNEVFEANRYDNTWGGTNSSGDLLPKGTYFYILDLGDGTNVRKGWIQIIR